MIVYFVFYTSDVDLLSYFWMKSPAFVVCSTSNVDWIQQNRATWPRSSAKSTTWTTGWLCCLSCLCCYLPCSTPSSTRGQCVKAPSNMHSFLMIWLHLNMSPLCLNQQPSYLSLSNGSRNLIIPNNMFLSFNITQVWRSCSHINEHIFSPKNR